MTFGLDFSIVLTFEAYPHNRENLLVDINKDKDKSQIVKYPHEKE